MYDGLLTPPQKAPPGKEGSRRGGLVPLAHSSTQMGGGNFLKSYVNIRRWG